MDTRTCGFVIVCVLCAARIALTLARMRLYRDHAQTFGAVDAPGVAARWRAALAQSGRSILGLGLLMCALIAVTALAAFHQGVPAAYAEAVAGAAVIWMAARVAVEVQYLFNRRLAAAQPEAAKRVAARHPRSGLVAEAVTAGYVFLPVAAAFLCVRVPFLLGGFCAATTFLLIRVGRFMAYREQGNG